MIVVSPWQTTPHFTTKTFRPAKHKVVRIGVQNFTESLVVTVNNAIPGHPLISGLVNHSPERNSTIC